MYLCTVTQIRSNGRDNRKMVDKAINFYHPVALSRAERNDGSSLLETTVSSSIYYIAIRNFVQFALRLFALR